MALCRHLSASSIYSVSSFRGAYLEQIHRCRTLKWVGALWGPRKDSSRDSPCRKQGRGLLSLWKEMPAVSGRRAGSPVGRKDRNAGDAREDPWLALLFPGGPPEWYQRLSANQEAVIGTSAWLSFCTAAALLLRIAYFNPTCVPSASMAPTLLPGDCVMVDIATYRSIRGPTRGDVVVFSPPGSSIRDVDGTLRPLRDGGPEEELQPRVQYVKRAIAVAGDTVQVKDGKVLVNGVPRREEALKLRAIRRERQEQDRQSTSSLLEARYEVEPVRVPPASLFVLGDNRNRSADSHVWGFLPLSQLVGRCWLRFWPLSRFGFL